MHSTTKYIGGHGTSIGGVIVDGGNFDWAAHPDRFPMLNKPDPSYHGAVWTEAVKSIGPVAYIIKARVTLLRDIGAAMSPFNAFQFIQGLETLPLRIARHVENTDKVVDFLSTQKKVTRIIHPSKLTGEKKRRAEHYLKGKNGALVGFEVAGGIDAGRKFIDSLEMFYHVANIGDARSLAIHPASTTHSQLSPEDRAEDRRHRRLCPACGRPRAYRRYSRRFETGVRENLTHRSCPFPSPPGLTRGARATHAMPVACSGLPGQARQ